MRTGLLAISVVASSLVAGAAHAAALDLSRYTVSNIFNLPPVAASESSAITYNWDNGNLYVMGDEGEAIVEVTRTGTVVSTMNMTGFGDTEGLTYIGGGKFVLVEERLQDAYQLTYTPGGTVARGSLPSASLGPTIGNTGLEGISYDRTTGKFIVVKEKSPQAVYEALIDFVAGTATVDTLIGDNALGLDDLSDVQVLAAGDELLIYSQESRKLLLVSRDGTVLSEFDFSAFSSTAEGVTIDENGTIYITDESPRVYVLTPVPEPSMALAWAAGVVGLAALRRRRR